MRKIRFCQDECSNHEHYMEHLCCRDCLYMSNCPDRCEMCDDLFDNEILVDGNEECELEED